MSILLALIGLVVIFLVLMDGFEAMVLPRRVTHPYRFTRLYYRMSWQVWGAAAGVVRNNRWRQTFLSLFGPLSLLVLFALWAVGLIFGFALVHSGLGTAVTPSGRPAGFVDYVYLSGDLFFTLGFGDVMPATALGRVLGVGEAGLGFVFIAVIIAYLPALYQAFSRREVTISLFDARAGSPPSAAEFLRRLGSMRQCDVVEPFLVEWERWASELLESQLSYPVLSFYRSQHDNQSWLAALTTVLDICALLMSALKDGPVYQAQLTFAMARHAAVDLALVFQSPPLPPDPERLSKDQWLRLEEQLRSQRLRLRDDHAIMDKLAELRGLYEPFVNALARRLRLSLPPIISDKPAVDNWQTTAWTRRAPGIGNLPASDDEHFV